MKPVLWKSDTNRSMEFCQVATAPGNFYVINGTVILPLENEPARVTYTITCDQQWRTRTVQLQQSRGGVDTNLTLEVSATQEWRSGGAPLPTLSGIFDVDISITPATNMLPLRRLNMAVGEIQMVRAAWVQFPGLNVDVLEQRYTRLDETHYLYEAPTHNFTSWLLVDSHSRVIRYGDAWEQVQPPNIPELP